VQHSLLQGLLNLPAVPRSTHPSKIILQPQFAKLIVTNKETAKLSLQQAHAEAGL